MTSENLAVKLVNINKWFGAVHANRNICLDVKKGTIHGIIGENGAGKSTLMSILYGFYESDSGEVIINGEKIDIKGPHDAIDAGIGMVFQHFMLVEPFTVVENVLLGNEGGATLKKGAKEARAHLEHLEREYQLEVDLDAPVGSLPVGLQQRVEILKALYRGTDILILDEPTGVLTPQEADHLFRILNFLREQGKTVIIITHKLREIMAITDEVSVMRRGTIVAQRETQKTNKDELAQLMVGRKVLLRVEKKPIEEGDVILDVQNLSVTDDRGVKKIKDVSFQLRKNEIVGIAGVAGNGQTEILEVLSGMRSYKEGKINFEGQALPQDVSPKSLRQLGIAHVPEDRLKMGLVNDFKTYENSVLGYHYEDEYVQKNFLINHNYIINRCNNLMETYDVRPQNPYLNAKSFSGGNQQKIVVCREMEHEPKLILVGQPTRGVDIGAIEFIHRRLIEMRDSGKSVLLVSVELDEIMSLSDRILVMFDGMIVGEINQRDANEKDLGLMMAGINPNEQKKNLKVKVA